MTRKREGDFSTATKEAAHERANHWCERCGVVPSQEIHHLLPIGVARHHYPSLSLQILSSLENAIALCEDCHTIADQESFDEHELYALRLLKAQLAFNMVKEVNTRIEASSKRHKSRSSRQDDDQPLKSEKRSLR